MDRVKRSPIVLMVVATTALHAQGNCNAPAKDPIVQLEVPGSPFEPVVSADGCRLFVTLASSNGAGQIAVVRREGGKLSLVRTVPVKGSPTGAVLTRDGKTLIVADGDYIAFLDAARLATGDGEPVLGYIGGRSGTGFIYAAVSADDKTLFVSAERAESIIVVNLERVRAGAIDSDAAIGKLDVGNAPVAVTLSPDGRYLYTTSQVAGVDWKWPDECRPENPAAGRAGMPRYHALGAVVVFDAMKAVTDPAHALVSRVAAGCNPVRLVLSPDGNTAYVTARGDNSLLAFDAHRMLGDGAHALLGKVKVGVAPVGIAVIDSGARIVVTNSNRFAGGGSDRQPLAVVDAAKLRAGGKDAVLGEIPAGGFPREIRVSADGKTMFVTNFTSGTVEMVDLARVRVR